MDKSFARNLNYVTVPYQDLMELYEPYYSSARKKHLYEEGKKLHSKITGNIEISRWGFIETAFEGGFPYNESCEITTTPLYYDYLKDLSTDERYVWYVNFADYMLFGFYGDNMFAQDEIQTTEHPLLGSVVQYLEKTKLPNMEPYTAFLRNKVTSPYLVENVPYWTSINTSVTMPDGSVHNLYGHNFFTEDLEVIKQGVKLIEEEVNNNIIAIAAPDDFYNEVYTREDLKYIIETLLSSFCASVEQAKKKGAKEIVIHSGNWGCGAFGGNPVLMYLTQFIAGNMSGVTKLVFHAPIKEAFDKALEYYDDFKKTVVEDGNENVKGKICSMKQLLSFLESYHFNWGTGDGN